jgi:short chain dehydrogenase
MTTPSKNPPVVLITGALTGMGRATALAFAHEGARLVVSGRYDDEGQKLVAERRKLGAEAEFLRSDVRHENDIRSLVDQTAARFGRLDVAVNLRIGQTTSVAIYGPTPGIDSHPDPLSRYEADQQTVSCGCSPDAPGWRPPETTRGKLQQKMADELLHKSHLGCRSRESTSATII